MIKASIDLAIAAATLIGLLSTALLWYRTRVEKSYAAQREFNHLRNSINNLSASIDKLLEQQDEAIDDIKRLLSAITTKLDVLPYSSIRDRTGWYQAQQDDPPTKPM